MTTTRTAVATERRLHERFEIRDVDTKDGFTRLAGRAVPYDEQADIGWFLEEHARGSFAKSIAEAARDLPLNLFHDNRTWPIGAADEWQDGRKALDAIWRLDHSEEAQRAAQLVDDRILTGLSIEFQPIRSDWQLAETFDPDRGPEYKDRVVRLESRMIGTALVQTGAFVGAQTMWVRAARAPGRDSEPRALRAWQAELDRLRRG